MITRRVVAIRVVPFSVLVVGFLVLVVTAPLVAVRADAAVKPGQRCTARELGAKIDGLICSGAGSNRIWRRTPATSAGPANAVTAGDTTKPATVNGSSKATPASASKPPVLLGIALGQTGSTTVALAKDQLAGVTIAAKYFNDHGGINGRPLQLDIRDTGGDDAGAVAAITTLIADQVLGIVGPSLSQQAFAADPIADRARVPVIAPSNTAANIPQIGDFIARVSPGPTASAAAAVRYADQLQPVSRAAVFFAQEDAFSRSETMVFQGVIRAAGIDLLPAQAFDSSDTDLGSATAFVEKNRPDLVVISGLPSAGSLVRRLRETGFGGAIIGGNGLNVAQTFSVCQAQCDGLIFAQPYSPEIPATGINAEWRSLFKADQNREPNTIAAQAFTAVQVFVEALRATEKDGRLAGPIDSARVELNRRILSGQYSTLVGDVSFDAVGEIRQQNFYIARVKMLRGAGGDDFAGRFVYSRM